MAVSAASGACRRKVTLRSVRCLCGRHADVQKRTDRLPRARPLGQSCNRWRQFNLSKCRHGAIPGYCRQPLRSRRARYPPYASALALVGWTMWLDGRCIRSACVAGTPSSIAGHRPRMPGGHSTCLHRPIRGRVTRSSLKGDFAWEPRDGYALTNTGWASRATRMPAFCNDCINATSSIRK